MTVPRFWRNIEARYNLLGSVCSKCGTVAFPPRNACPKCNSIHLNKQKLKGTGKIVTHTTLHTPQEGFEHEIPYTLAIIELDEGPRITAEIVDTNEDNIKIGSRVKSCFRRVGEEGPSGMIYYGYKFKLVKDEND